STWLNDREWEDPTTRPSPVDQRCYFHRLPGTARKRPPQNEYVDSCPECRHVKAANGTRQADPAPFRPPAAPKSLPTAAELAALRPPKRLKVVIQQSDGSEQPVDLEAAGG